MANLMESSELRGAGFGGKPHGQSNLDDNTYRVPMPEPKSNPMIIDGQEVKPAQMPNIEPEKQLKPSEYPKDHPLNPDYKSPLEKSEAPPATGQQSSNGTAATASAMARELPGEEKGDVATNPNRAGDERKSALRNVMNALKAAFGGKITDEEAKHIEVAADAKPQINMASAKGEAEKVTGRQIGDIDPTTLAMATENAKALNKNGAVLQDDSSMKYAGAAQLQALEQSRTA